MIKAWLRKIRAPRTPRLDRVIPEISPAETALLERFSAYTMTGIERQWALISAISYLNANRIPGDVVECGVWRGGNMLIAKELCKGSPLARKFYLYDTFAGMSAPSAADVTSSGEPAEKTYRERQRSDHTDWVYASLDDVRDNFRNAGLLDDEVFFIKGKVEDTLRIEADLPKQIALLRLDTDFYESTKAELEVLYPRLVPGGVMIVDDYGHWRGARKAVDEYFRDAHPLLVRIDYTARLMVKR
jgi:O-methyltransferase